MNRIISSIMTLASLTTIFAVHFDNQLKITYRLNAGTMIHDVRRVHTQVINGKVYTSEPSVDANMSHLRHLSVCSTKPDNCRSTSTVW